MAVTASIVAAALAAGGTAYSANQQKKAAESASQPKVIDNAVLPYDSTRGHLDRYIDGFVGSQDQYRQNGPRFYQGQMPGGGQSQGTRDAYAGLEGIMDEGLGATIQEYIGSSLGQPTGLTQDAYNQTSNYQPAYYDSLIQGLAGGGLAQDPYLQQLIERGLAGGATSNANGGGFGGGGGGGGGAVAADFSGLGEPTNDWMREVLDGEFLNADNPAVAELLDSIGREGLETYTQSVVPQIDADFNRAGRFGSGAYAQAQGIANEEYQETVGQQKAGVLNSNFQSERDRMLSALGMLNSLDQSKIASATALAGQGTSANIAGANRSSQEGLAREGMLLEAILGNAGMRMDGLGMASDLTDSLYGRDNDRLSLLHGAAANDQDYQLGLLGAGNTNLGIEAGAQTAALGARSSGDASRNANAWQRWGIQNDRFNRANTWDLDSYRDGADFLTRIGSAFPQGNGSTSGVYQPYTDPAVAGLLSGVGTYGASGGFSGGNSGGGGKNSGGRSLQ